MYVKWRTHRYARTYPGVTDAGYWGPVPTGEIALYKEAVLVRAVRINGKPRHETIAYLGCFPVAELERVRDQPTGLFDDVRGRFWDRAHAQLDALHLDHRTYFRLQAQLEAVIQEQPQPDEATRARRQRWRAHTPYRRHLCPAPAMRAVPD
jgi:hypothetical protein